MEVSFFADLDLVDAGVAYLSAVVDPRKDLNLRPPGPEQQNHKFQVLHLVSLRNQNSVLSLAQLSRSCTEPSIPIWIMRHSLAIPVRDSFRSDFPMCKRPCSRPLTATTLVMMMPPSTCLTQTALGCSNT